MKKLPAIQLNFVFENSYDATLRSDSNIQRIDCVLVAEAKKQFIECSRRSMVHGGVASDDLLSCHRTLVRLVESLVAKCEHLDTDG